MEAASRRAERESQRRYHQLQRDEKQRAKMEARQQAAYEVELFENQLERLTSVHKESPEVWDWNSIHNTPPPAAPERASAREATATAALNAFVPGFLDKLLGRAETKRQALAQAVDVAKAQDEQEYQQVFQEYSQRCTDWDERRQLAGRILQGDTQAYVDALMDFNPFADLSELGASIDFKPHDAQLVEVRLTADGGRLIPDQVKSLTSTGKLSTKPMPKGQFNDLYLDFVCGVALRAGRELFAFLPVQTVLVNVQANLLNTRTGHQGLETILSVAMARTVFAQLNFDRLDPSDAMENFPHRMDFKKTAGFGPIPLLVPTGEGTIKTQGTSMKGKQLPLVLAENSISRKWADAKRNNQIESGFLRLTANELAALLGDAPQDNFSLPDSKKMARAVEQCGFCVEPDPRWGAGNYWGTREIGVFQPSGSVIKAPSDNALGASALLQLLLLVAAADGAVSHEEFDPFREFVEREFQFSPDERQRLVVLESLLARNSASAKVTLGRTAKRVPQEKHAVVAHLLLDVATADGVVTSGEYKALARIFDALGLSKGTLDTMIRGLADTGQEFVIQTQEPGQAGETIPPRPEGAPIPPKPWSLDMVRVAAITSETHEVIGLLAKAMSDEDSKQDSDLSDEVPLSPRDVVPPPSPAPSARFIGLDAAFHPVLERLLARESWPRSEFHALAGEFHLMPLSIHDVINEWADESLGDFLLEGEDPILIRWELILKGTT